MRRGRVLARRWCGEAGGPCGAGAAISGCRGLRKVCGRALAKMRGLAGKEGGVFGRGAWAGMSRAGEEAGGETGCGGLRAWGWAGLHFGGATNHS